MAGEYLLILLFLFASAFYVEWKYKIHLYHSFKERLVITLHFFVLGTAWDTFAVWRSHWSFPGEGLIGVKIWLLPLEEYLFFLIMPFFILTVYKAYEHIFHRGKPLST
ncbi:MAG: lycopene cyclase domain-containing protein [Candidatus Yanofskybacteria bacterium]|nr:lycopene cyclase domain-containing protein [Candidatus Yanofskybacteria bacterium]